MDMSPITGCATQSLHSRLVRRVGVARLALMLSLLFPTLLIPNLVLAAETVLFTTSFESGDVQPTWNNSVDSGTMQHIGGYCCDVNGMESTPRTGEVSHTGMSALLYSGTDLSPVPSYSYNKVFDVDIPVSNDTALSYWIFPLQPLGRYVAIDLIFTDGSTLRDSGAVDQHGIGMHPGYQGGGGFLVVNTWNQVRSVIGARVAGKTIDRILVGYDEGTTTGQYRGFIDDITISTGVNNGGNVIQPRVVTPIHQQDDVVVASRVVTDAPYNADVTGVSDATAAIQQAINDCYNAGGGVVWLPSGKYNITSSIQIKNHVTLRGDWRDPDVGNGSYGTVILANVASGNELDAGLFRIWGSAGVKGLTFYYPNQSATNPIPYPYTLEILGRYLSEDGYMSGSVQNITLLNAYRGISAGAHATHELHLLRNIKGTALANAIYLQDTADVGKVERVTFNNSYWANLDPSIGLDKPVRGVIDTWTRANGIGLQIGGVEWDQLMNIAVSDYKVGVGVVPGRRIGTTAMLAGISVRNSNIGLRADNLDARVGLVIANSTFQANQGIDPIAVKIVGNAGASVIFNNTIIGGGAAIAVQIIGNSMVSFHGCTFDNWTGVYAIDANHGTIVVEGSTFTPTLSASKKGIRLQNGVSSAAILGNMYSSPNPAYMLDNTSTGDVQRNDTDYTFTHSTLTSYTQRPTIPRPISSAFYNVKLAPYGAKGDSTTDDTSAIQTALNTAASGGGTVYLPAGIYVVRGHLNVPAGVELRGSDDVPHRAQRTSDGIATGTILFAYEGRATPNPDTASPFITVNGTISAHGGGVRGLSIHYPEQATDSASNIVAYPWTIRGNGPGGVYVMDVALTNAYRAIDFATNTTDNHVINQVVGLALKEGIRVGNSTQGWVEDNLFNITAWARTGGLPGSLGELTTMFPVAAEFTRNNLRAFVATSGATNEYMLNNFVYGAETGYTFEGNANVKALNIAADGGRNTLTILNSGSNGTVIVNAEGCGCGQNGTALSVAGGSVQVFNLLTMETYNRAVSISGGNVLLQGAAFHHNVATIQGGSIIMNGVLFRDTGTHVTVDSGATANLWGNIGGGSAFMFTFQPGSNGGYSRNIRR